MKNNKANDIELDSMPYSKSKLTNKELMGIVKAVVAFNGGKVEFNEHYLERANEHILSVERDEKGVITLRIIVDQRA